MRVSNFFNGFGTIKGYIATALAAFSFYVVTTLNGCSLTGDDNAQKELHNTRQQGAYYHK